MSKQQEGYYSLSKAAYPNIHIAPDCTIIDDGVQRTILPQNITVELWSDDGTIRKCIDLEKLIDAWNHLLGEES